MRELSADTIERQRRSAETRSELLRAVRGAICNERNRGAARHEVANRELADLAGADHDDRAAAQVPEDLLRKGGRGRRDRRGALTNRRLGARFLAGVERLAKEPVEDRAGCASLVRCAHLAEDLPFAGDERVQARGNAEEVERGFLVTKPVESRPQLGLERQQGGLSLLLRTVGRFVRQIQLRAVAGGEADRFALSAGQCSGELGRALWVESGALTQLHGRLAMRDADEDDAHVAKCVTGRASRTTATSTKPARTRYAARLPRQPAR